MKRMAWVALGLAAACETTTGGAGGFVTANGVRVNPVSSEVFEVIPRGDGTIADFWCGAAEYARRVQGAAGSDRIYVVHGIAPGVTIDRKSTAQFSTNPSARPSAATPASVDDRLSVGSSLTVTQGKGRCRTKRESQR